MSYDYTEDFSFDDIVEDGMEDSALPNGYGEQAPAWLKEEIEGIESSMQKLDDPDFDVNDDEDYNPEEEEQAEDDTHEFHRALDEIAEDFDSLNDDFEFTIHGEKVTKADIADVVRTRADMQEAYEGLNAYVSNLAEVEMRVQTYLQASMTETETKLRQVEQLLEHPERMSASEVQRTLMAQRELRARQNQLEANAKEVRAAEEDRRMQLDLMRIRQTDAELKAKVPNYKGLQTMREIVGWAQEQGISETDIKSSMSPGMIKALMDAKLYREKVSGKASILEASQKRVSKSPKSVPTKPKQQRSRVGAETGRARAYEKAIQVGDMSEAFKFLID